MDTRRTPFVGFPSELFPLSLRRWGELDPDWPEFGDLKPDWPEFGDLKPDWPEFGDLKPDWPELGDPAFPRFQSEVDVGLFELSLL